MTTGLYYEDVALGMELPALVKRPTAISLFRFSAVTWNSHRIHYDAAWARREGYPDALVQAHLHGAYLTQLVMDWIGPTGVLRKLSWSNRHFAVPGDTLTCRGRVVGLEARDGEHLVDCEIWEENQDGRLCAPGMAQVRLPARQ